MIYMIYFYVEDRMNDVAVRQTGKVMAEGDSGRSVQ
jgi:hypothetical protein